MALSREEILSADDLRKELVPVPEWGGEVWVRALTGTERDTFEATSIVQKGKDHEVNLRDIRARLCIFAICDAQGKRLFGAHDIEILGAKSSAALSRVYEVAERLSGFSKKDMEELAKNSEAGPSAGSGLSSPTATESPSRSCKKSSTPATSRS